MSIQTISIHKTALNDVGITIAGPDNSVTVASGVTVASDLGDGVFAPQSGSNLFNYGQISSSKFQGYGVHSSGPGQLVYNAAEGSINGYYGVGLSGNQTNAMNLGSIVAEKFGFAFDGTASADKLDNRGFIFAKEHGVVDTSTVAGNFISNSGTIEGLAGGFAFSTWPGLVTHLVNSGTIQGGTYSILGALHGAIDVQNSGKLVGDISLHSTAGNDTIVNSGSISGVTHLGGGNDSFNNAGATAGGVFGEDGKDTIINTGRIGGAVQLGNGNDTFNGAGGSSGAIFGEAGNDTITGGSGADTIDGGIDNDTLKGGLGNDTLTGGAGSDRLFGGLGNDRLTGGAGNDFFVFDTKPNATANRDIIADFVHGADKFQLENAVFAALGTAGHLNAAYFHLGTAAADANDHIIYDRAHGNLFYDSNGDAAGGATLIATLSNKPLLTAADFLVI
jgi:Ca2+-binding RTX toxin-like protein